MDLFRKEPALVIGALATIIVIVATQALNSGIVSSDGAVKWANFIVAVVPLVAAVLTRSQVSPAQ